MTMAYTPGPWRVDGTKTLGAYGVWTDYTTHPGHDNDGYASQICSMCPTQDTGILQEQRDANARLIAAAPDLFESCKKLLSAFEGTKLSDSLIRTETDAIRAAIAKAESK